MSASALTPTQIQRQQNAVYKKYFRRIKGYYINETRNYTLSDELAQGAMFKVFNGMDSFDQERSMENWVHGIARNHLIDHFRSAGSAKNTINRTMVYVSEYHEDMIVGDADEIFAGFTKDDFGSVLDGLSEDHKTMAIDHYINNLDANEISRKTGLQPSTVKNRLSQLRYSISDKLRNFTE